MPRPPEATPLRRVLEQVIMWVVLVATVGAAAWVSGEVNELGPPQTFDGITVRLPKRWAPTDEHDGETVLEVRERGDPRVARTLSTRRASRSWGSWFVAPSKRVDGMTLDGDVPAQINVFAERVGSDPSIGTVYKLEVFGEFTSPQGKSMALSIRQMSYGSVKRDTQRNVKLLKRVLATVRFGGAQ